MKNIVVIGAGLIGERHIEKVLAHENCCLAAIVEPNVSIVQKVNVPVYSSIEEVDVPVDGAIIATPTGLHLQHAIICADRGWDLLIEKPVAETMDQADELVAKVEEADVKTLIGHHRRYHKSVSALRNLLINGTIGQPITATAIWAVRKPDDYFKGNWREGPHGSPILINLVHDIDLLRYFFGEICDVAGFGVSPVRKAGRIESGALALKFHSGCIATISFADTAPSPWGFEAGTGENPNIGTTGQDMLWITGTKGGVSFPSMTVWTGAENWAQIPKSNKCAVDNTVPLEAQLDHFCEVMENISQPIISANDGRETLRIALQAQAILSSDMVTSERMGRV